MTNREAINVLKKNYPKKCKMVDGRLTAGFDDTESELGKALSMAIAALEKQEPVRPDYHTCGAGEYYTCPKCGYRGVNDYYGNYCNKCGQLLSWEEGTE